MAELLSSDVGFTNRDEYKDKPEWYYMPKEEDVMKRSDDIRSLYPDETPENSMEILRRGDASEMPNLLARKKAEDDAIRAEAMRRIEAEGGIDKVAAAEKARRIGVGGKPPADYKTPAERIEFFKSNRAGFQEYLFNNVLGGNPFEIDPVVEMRKADAKLPELFNHVFRGKISWSDRETMTKKQRDYWIQTVQKYHADIEDEAKNKKKMATDKYNFFMNQYDNGIKEDEALQKKIDALDKDKVWIHNPSDKTKMQIPRRDVATWLNKGYKIGEPYGSTTENKTWIFNPEENIKQQVSPEEAEKLVGTGKWKHGQPIGTPSKGELTENQVARNINDLAITMTVQGVPPDQVYARLYNKYRELVKGGSSREDAYTHVMNNAESIMKGKAAATTTPPAQRKGRSKYGHLWGEE